MKVSTPQFGEAPIWHGLAAGAVAGLTSRLVVYPGDNLKAQMQLFAGMNGSKISQMSTATLSNQPDLTRTTAALFKQVRADGLRGLYRGCSVVLLGAVPGNICYYTGYELGKKIVHRYEQARGVNHNSSFELRGVKGDMLTGAIAQSFAGIVFTPMDAIKERMQAQKLMGGGYQYKNGWDGLKQIVRQDGFKGLLRGYWINSAVWIPWNMIYIATYEATKRMALEYQSGDEGSTTLPPMSYASCAAFSSAVALLVTNPVDVVKTRLQVRRGISGNASLRASDIVRELWKNEGLVGFTSGLAPRVLALAPGCAICWYLYENIKIKLNKLGHE